MSIFNELLLPKLQEISNNTIKNFNNKLQEALECLDKFEEEYQNGRGSARERAQREKVRMTALQSIHEDDDETKTLDSVKTAKPDDDTPLENGKKRVSKKRSRDEVEGVSSPEQDRRTKRNASVKAQSIISKQKEREILKALNENGVAFVSSEKMVNVNLNQKMRREDSATSLADKKSKRRNEDDKENSQPVPAIQIKQEKVSLPPEPMDTDSIPIDVTVKQELSRDEAAMPPPSAPVPKPRKALQKEKEKKKDQEDNVSSDNEESGRRRNTRTRKQTDSMPPPPAPAPVASARSTRASSRASRRGTKLDADDSHAMPPPPEQRPKRTRGRKKISESSTESEKNSTQTVVENGPSSPADKPRPKRTRRGKNAEKEPEPQKQEKPQTANEKDFTTAQISPKEERISQPTSPVLQKPKKDKKTTKSKAKKTQNAEDSVQIQNLTSQSDVTESATIVNDTKLTQVASNMNVTVTLNDMDKTMVLPNGVYNHAPDTPKTMQVNETVILETCRETMVLDKQNINDATVVLDKPTAQNITDNNSLLTDDGSENECSPRTPPGPAPSTQPTSAVKEKVQQFEELAARTTRTKTRAMAKMEDDQDTHTPPDKMIKPILSQETLNKMNSMIFNGKPPQVSSASVSASKPRAIPVSIKSTQPASTSKLSALSRHKEAAEREKEDARKKKEALLEAKRELQKKKREEKMANAAAAREAADRERKIAMEAAAKERLEKQLHADQGKQERLKEAERKKQELARKVAETEERRRAEEAARTQRLALEQKKAEAARKKQLEEAEAMKKEAALMAKEIEKKQREYLEKQKLKQRLEDKVLTPLKPGMVGYRALSPVYMADGFQYLNSDEEEDTTPRPVPAWSMSKARKLQLAYQSALPSTLIDALFSVRVHSPDLRAIFPNIERARLKRTSSAVWRTPPRQIKE